MKKLTTLLFALVIAVCANAQDLLKLNESGDLVITETLQTSNDAARNFQNVKNWINTQGYSNMSINKEETNKELVYTLTKNTKSRYNPFAGQFTENLIFSFTLTTKGNTVTYTINNTQLQEIYMGYGAKNTMTSLPQIINKLNSIKSSIADAEASGDKKTLKALKKQHKDDIEDITESLQKVEEVIVAMKNGIKNAVGAK